MKVWLIDHMSGIPADTTSEGRGVRRGVQSRLQNWFGQVASHRKASSGRPQGHERNIEVAWGPAGSAAGPYDLVLHFVPSQPGQNPPVMGPWREAVQQTRDDLVTENLSSRQRGFSGGKTLGLSIGSQRVPALSLVIVLYDAQMSRENMRISANVESLCIVAFHEAAHNKDRSASLHTGGGGGVFADIHTGGLGSAARPNNANIAFMAERIWNWGPQYIVGGSMSPVSPP
jgi:hypothetical protein